MSSRGPPLFPDSTNAGIIVNPRTLERVIPATKRADGSVRKEIKIRPGFTPVEDVAVFRGRRQQQAAPQSTAAPGVPGWTPAPSTTSKPAPKPAASASAASSGEPQSKAAAKNAKRAEKRKEKRVADQIDFVRQQYGESDPDAPAKSATKSADASVDELADQLKDTTVN